MRRRGRVAGRGVGGGTGAAPHLVEERRPARPTVEFSSYWRRALTQDDAPTAEDLAWAQERAGGFGAP